MAIVPLGASATLRPAPLAEMTGAGMYAVLVAIIVGPAFSFDAEMDYFNVVINFAVTLAACVILTEVLSFLILSSDNVRAWLDFIKLVLICTSMVLIAIGYVFLAPEKNSSPLGFYSVLARPIPAVLIMKRRGSKTVSGDLLLAILYALRFIRKHPSGSAVGLSIAVAVGLKMLIGDAQNPQVN